ncbi:galactokinase [Coemansia spiralis]|uniref:Galactokinase n=2 Tax=Coemansia TaxID=4863 RepID=A0A9W8G8J4_9FUNG|nr:galactokinase [Coemansia spiralis]
MFTAISDIYADNLLKHGVRYQTLVEKFVSIYGEKPDFIARAPGRVNIIGEHIDYCGFPVFPMAIVPDCLVAVRSIEEKIVDLANVNHEYPARRFSYNPVSMVSIDNSQQDWTNYFKCGYKGALKAIDCNAPKGMQCLMDGNVPRCVGLSSSSAVVCCAALATMEANNRLLSQENVVEASVASERYIGTNGGGMDQTASIMSQPHSASFIEFDPELSVTPVRIPSTEPPLAFVIANTLVAFDKAVTAPVYYNLRVVETRVGALILAKCLGIADRPACKNVDPLTFKIVMDEYFSGQDTAGKSEVDVWIERLTAMFKASSETFGSHPGGYTRDEMAQELGITTQQLSNKVHEAQFPVRAERFQLLKRAQHAFSEALRVVRFRQICEQTNDRSSTCGDVGKALGDLMNQSQDSCRDLFECSCKELDELCEIARGAGSLGSRLTGAGWGGCSVHLVSQPSIDRFIDTLKERYYSKHHSDLSPEQLKETIFVTVPGSGAGIYLFDS